MYYCCFTAVCITAVLQQYSVAVAVDVERRKKKRKNEQSPADSSYLGRAFTYDTYLLTHKTHSSLSVHSSTTI